jgi:Ca2+:H+ antiporter
MTSTTDRTPLLENGSGLVSRRSFRNRFFDFFRADGEPSWAASYKFFVFGSWWNISLLFVPLSIIAHELNWDAALRFLFSFCAIIPLAKVLS